MNWVKHDTGASPPSSGCKVHLEVDTNNQAVVTVTAHNTDALSRVAALLKHIPGNINKMKRLAASAYD